MTSHDRSCELCDHAAEHGAWPPEHRGTHCRVCHRSWRSLVEAHCTICHLHFSTDNTATVHEPFCHPDTDTAREQVLAATAEFTRGRFQGQKHPLLVSRTRVAGETFVRWSPGGAPYKRQHPQDAS